MSDTCPNCGYCKHCGRGLQIAPAYPINPWINPIYPYQPAYQTNPVYPGVTGPVWIGAQDTFTVSSGSLNLKDGNS